MGKPIGVIEVEITYLSQIVTQPIFVIAGDSPCLMGRKRLAKFAQIGLAEIVFHVCVPSLGNIRETLRAVLRYF